MKDLRLLIGFGVGIGIALGIVFDNIAIGIALGAVFVISMAIAKKGTTDKGSGKEDV